MTEVGDRRSWADRHLDLTDDEFGAIVAGGLLFAVPTGTIHEYSNFGYAVLGRVVQRASGRRIQEIVSEELLPALGMHATTWTQPMHGDWAPPLDWRDGGFVDELPPLGDGLIAPMGGIWTTVADLARWVTWLDDAYPARDEPDDGPLAVPARCRPSALRRVMDRGGIRRPAATDTAACDGRSRARRRSRTPAAVARTCGGCVAGARQGLRRQLDVAHRLTELTADPRSRQQ
jgi:CubicO group peptidase (beta-lactamase class C family)